MGTGEAYDYVPLPPGRYFLVRESKINFVNWLFSNISRGFIFANRVFPEFSRGLIFANEVQSAKISPREN